MGHMDIIRRGATIFDRLVVSVLQNPAKSPLFTIDERMEMLHDACRGLENVEVRQFGGLLVAHARQMQARVVLKGLRIVSDFEYELQQAHFNRQLAPELDTVFLATESRNAFLSSSLVKEVALLGGNVTGLVPQGVESKLTERLREMG